MKFVSYLYFSDFWCSVITVPHHYCAVPPTGKMVEQNNVLLYSLPINHETIERSNYKHCFKCSPGKLWGMGGTKQSMATKKWKLIKCDLLGFIFLSSFLFLASINCNVEHEYGEYITESQGYCSNLWQANQLYGECSTTVWEPSALWCDLWWSLQASEVSWFHPWEVLQMFL